MPVIIRFMATPGIGPAIPITAAGEFIAIIIGATWAMVRRLLAPEAVRVYPTPVVPLAVAQ